MQNNLRYGGSTGQPARADHGAAGTTRRYVERCGIGWSAMKLAIASES